MTILLLGKDGQVGWQLQRSLAPHGKVVACGRAECDLGDIDQLRRVVRQVNPAVIVNASAYTAVDRAESEPDLARRINAEAPGVLAEESARVGALMIHYSTDYVFDGCKEAPYFESVDVKVAKGDRLFFYSDGLIENHHGVSVPRKEGMHILEESLIARRALPLAEMVEEAALSICGANENPGDDLLLLGVEI